MSLRPAAMHLVVVTGMSGSGKSVVLNALEDAGYFCVDNLPIRFLSPLAHSLQEEGHRRVAVAADVRVSQVLRPLQDSLSELTQLGVSLQVIFLNAQTQTLVHRYSETRRRHPLSIRPDIQPSANQADQESEALTLLECIQKERQILEDIELLGLRIDTTDLKPSALRAWVRELLGLLPSPLSLLFQSFAYKDGIPLDADIVFDVRCLPNPFYIDKLKALTGHDQAVMDFLAQQPQVPAMIDDMAGFLRRWLASYQTDQRGYLTVALGCTGGQHRSVYCAEALAGLFKPEWSVKVRHRGLSLRGLS